MSLTLFQRPSTPRLAGPCAEIVGGRSEALANDGAWETERSVHSRFRRVSPVRYAIGPGDLDLASGVREHLAGFAEDLSAAEKAGMAEGLAAAAAQARTAERHWDFMSPAWEIEGFLTGMSPQAMASEAGKFRLRRAVVAGLALNHFEVKEGLTPVLVEGIPRALESLCTFLRRARAYDDDYFAKDVRYALGLTIACGAMQIDLYARVGPSLMLRPLRRGGSWRELGKYVGAGGWGRWYQDHLDLRYMKEFTPSGWTDFFVRMASLLEINPEVRGVMGVSWYYDPLVPRISPELAFVRMPLTQGAFYAPLGVARHHVKNAIALSEHRRKLVESGQYAPTGYLMAWPRAELIAWAGRLKADPTLSFEYFDGIHRT